MSVDGYLGPNKPRMSETLKCDEGKGVEGTVVPEGNLLGGQGPDGICYRESVQEMIEALKYPETARRRWREECGSECYETVEDYDPVLAWHCRLDI